MTDRKTCTRCERKIDAWARLCPFCNWDQSELPPLRAAVIEPTARAETPSEEPRWRQPALLVVGFGALLFASFALGSLVHRKNPSGSVRERANALAGAHPMPRANVTLVPVNVPAPELEQPITSAPATNPAEGVMPEYQRNDATAVSSQDAQLAEKVNAEKKTNPLIDPRTITGEAYAGAPRQTEKEASIDVDTQPVPEYQPLPDIHVSQLTTTRLELTIGPDGRVQDVDINKSIPQDMSKLIAAVQSWRFKPATQNGEPVAAPFRVEISFNPNE